MQPNTQITDSQIQAYEAKKGQLEQQVTTTQRDLIILEEQLKQQNDILMSTFQTTDPVALTKIMDNYQTEIVKLESELAQLEVTL